MNFVNIFDRHMEIAEYRDLIESSYILSKLFTENNWWNRIVLNPHENVVDYERRIYGQWFNIRG